MSVLACDIAVAGAGPAGLAAALAAGRSGAKVVVIDSFPLPGGQYFMQPSQGEAGSAAAADGAARIAACRAAGVTFLQGSEIVAAYPGFRLLLAGAGGGSALTARALIAASGAHERTMAFPGWVLPGVMNAGAGQRLMKAHGVPPGTRVIIAGSGVFLWAVAETLAQHGVEIAALVEARRPSLALAAHLAAHPGRWGEVASLVRNVKAGVGRVIWGHIVCEAAGTDRLESVTVEPTAGGAAQVIGGVDALLVSHGFQPNIELTSLLGCRHAFDDGIGGWHVTVDTAGQTSVPGLFAAGEVTGIAGMRPAVLSGERAGHSAAAQLGYSPTGRVDSAALARALRFGQGLMRLFAPLPELQRVQRDDTILCRCEEVTRGEVVTACREGAGDLHNVKTWTRAGMGRCQGRMCRMSLTDCLSRELGKPAQALGYNNPRIPLRPVPIDLIMAASEASESPPRAPAD